MASLKVVQPLCSGRGWEWGESNAGRAGVDKLMAANRAKPTECTHVQAHRIPVHTCTVITFPSAEISNLSHVKVGL